MRHALSPNSRGVGGGTERGTGTGKPEEDGDGDDDEVDDNRVKACKWKHYYS